jgi:hypothetical protein
VLTTHLLIIMSSCGGVEVRRLQHAGPVGSEAGQGKNEHRFSTTQLPRFCISPLLLLATYSGYCFVLYVGVFGRETCKVCRVDMEAVDANTQNQS